MSTRVEAFDTITEPAAHLVESARESIRFGRMGDRPALGAGDAFERDREDRRGPGDTAHRFLELHKERLEEQFMASSLPRLQTHHGSSD